MCNNSALSSSFAKNIVYKTEIISQQLKKSFHLRCFQRERSDRDFVWANMAKKTDCELLAGENNVSKGQIDM